MSLPQKVEPGMLAFGTRRCVEGMFSLKPIAEVTAIVWYAFAFAVITHEVTPHALVAMSNHLHWLVTDVRGNLPEFKRDFHRMVAAAVKKLWGLEGTVFADTNCRHVEVLGLRGAIKQALYCVLNPVRAHLVEKAMQWPGALWRPGMREVTVKKPDVWFTGAHWPEQITIRFEPPTAWNGSEDAWHERLGEMLSEEEATLARERLRTGRPVLGAQRVKQQHHRSRPRTKLDKGGIDPAFATGGDHELEKKAKRELKAWRRAYKDALERWKLALLLLCSALALLWRRSACMAGLGTSYREYGKSVLTIDPLDPAPEQPNHAGTLRRSTEAMPKRIGGGLQHPHEGELSVTSHCTIEALVER